MYTSISSEETYANEQPPIAQAMKTCAHELSPIAQAGKTCADGLPHTKYTIAQAGGNMCSSRSSYSSFWARWASSCSSFSSPWANMRRWAILSIAQALKTCADGLPSYSSSLKNMRSSSLTSELPLKRASSSYDELICPTGITSGTPVLLVQQSRIKVILRSINSFFFFLFFFILRRMGKNKA